MKPLKHCVNGCATPPAPPSKILCQACLDKLTVKLHKILSDFTERRSPRPGSPAYPPGTLYGLIRRDNLRWP